jgi:hypothetical protein
LDADFTTALVAALSQNTTATYGFHATAKTMYFLTLTLIRLKSSFHEKTTIPLKLGFVREPHTIAETGEKSDDSIL